MSFKEKLSRYWHGRILKDVSYCKVRVNFLKPGESEHWLDGRWTPAVGFEYQAPISREWHPVGLGNLLGYQPLENP